MRRQKWKRFLAAIFTAVMCLGEVGGTGMTVLAQDAIVEEDEALSEEEAASENEALSEDAAVSEDEAAEEDAAVSEDAAAAEAEEAAEADEADAAPEEEAEEAAEEPDAAGTTYNLWVGGVLVSEGNLSNIPGVTGGTASYDPATNTLTLNGVAGFSGQHENAYIYGENLNAGDKMFWLKGDAEFNISDDTVDGILITKSEVGFDADLRIGGEGYPVSIRDLPLTIAGGNYELKSTKWTALHVGGGLYMQGGTVVTESKKQGIKGGGELWFNAGDVTATGEEYGILSNEAVYVSGGIVRATATGKPESSASHVAVDDGKYSGLYVDGSLMVTGGHMTASGDMHGVYTNGDITIDRGTRDAGYLEATATGATHAEKTVERVGTFANNADITVQGGWLKSAGQGGAVASYKGTINVSGDAAFLEPTDGSVRLYDQDQNRYPEKTTATISTATLNPITEVLIGEEDGGYGLYLGSVEVTAMNREDIPIASGKASYDPLTGTLKCEDAVINTCHGVDMTQAIRVEDDLTITGKLTINKVDDSGYGIIIDGHHTLTFKDADVTATGMKYRAIHVPSGSIEVINSKLDVSAMEGGTYDYAIYAADKLVLDKAWIKAKSNKGAIAYGYLDGREKHTIVAPANAWFDNYLVADKTSNQAVLDVEIEPAMDGEIWVGNTRVTMSNMDDVLGDGRVSYDPDTRTLRFAAGSEINSGHDVTYKQLANIYADKDLRVEGIVKLSMKAYYAIYCEGSLTLDADIEGESTGVFVVSNGTLSVEGGTINGSAKEFGFYANRIEISGGDISLSAAVTRGAVMYSTKGDTLISGGKLNLTANSMKPAVCTEGDFRMTDGYLNARSDDRAISSKTITIDEDVMRIANPEGAYVKKGSRDELINPATGFGAHEVLIYKKGTQDVTVSFDMGGHGTNASQTLKDGAKVSEPTKPTADGWIFAGWFADPEFVTSFDFNKEIIKDTTIYAKWYEHKESYELWLGKTLVSGDKCLDIFGDGKASYDPTTNTLTLKDYTGDGTFSVNSGNKILIHAKQDLTIKGSATLTSNTANIGIDSESGNLTIDADLTINLTTESESVVGAIRALGGDITIDGGSINCTVNPSNEEIQSFGIAVGSGKITINDGITSLNAGLFAIASLGANADLIMNGGELQANGLNDTSAGIFWATGKLQMNAGTLKASGHGDEGTAVAFAESVADPDYVEIVKPVNGKWDDKGQKVLNPDGTTAMEVEIARRQFTVTFDLNGKTVYEGTAPEAQKVYAGKPALEPEYPPVAEGFAFKGWYTDQACTEKFVFFDSSITKDTTLYAKWVEGFNVSFDVGDAPVATPMDQAVEEGGLVEEPVLPAVEGMELVGWYKNLSDDSAYDFSTPVNSSFTLYAKWAKEKRTVTFDGNGHVPAPAPVEVEYGDAVTEPTAPTADGFKFMGWYVEAACIHRYDFSSPVKDNITLYARWVDATVQTWIVSFDLNGMPGTAPAAQEVVDGETAARPEAPEVAGRTFKGWYTSRSCADDDWYNFATPVSSDLTLYAKWEMEEDVPGFIVSFADTSYDIYNGLVQNVDGIYETVYAGGAIKPAIRVIGAYGRILIEGEDYTVKYSNNVKANNKKPAKVTVKGKGIYKGSKVLEFYIVPADLGILESMGKLVVPQQYAKGGKANVVLYYGSYALKAKDYEKITASVSEATALDIKGKGNFKGSIKETFLPLSAADAKAKTVAKVKVKVSSVVYNGMTQTPEVTVTAGDGSVLTEYKDYTLRYVNNQNVGKAVVVAEGCGEYFGAASAPFMITPDKDGNVVVSRSSEKVAYDPNGATIGLSVTVGGRFLVEGVSYNVKFSNNKKVGNGKYTISFKGNYKGLKPVSGDYTIEAASIAGADFFVGSMTYTKPGKYFSKVYVTDRNVLLKEKKDYTVSYYTDDACTTALPAKYTMEEGKTQVTLYAKITGAGSYKDDSKVVSFTVYKADAEKFDLSKARIVEPATLKKPGKVQYNGTALEPVVIVQVKVGKEWKTVPESAYTITYSNNVNMGKATIVVSGKGTSATGSKAVTFSIKAKDMKGFEQG